MHVYIISFNVYNYIIRYDAYVYLFRHNVYVYICAYILLLPEYNCLMFFDCHTHICHQPGPWAFLLLS